MNIKVTNLKNTYSKYKEWFNYHPEYIQYKEHFHGGYIFDGDITFYDEARPIIGNVYKVVGEGKHHIMDYRNILLIRDVQNDDVFLVGENPSCYEIVG